MLRTSAPLIGALGVLNDMRTSIFGVCAILAAMGVSPDGFATTTSLACIWQKSDVPELITDLGARTAEAFLTDSRMPLYLDLDIDSNSISHPNPKDIDALLIPRMSLVVSENELEIALDGPNWKGTLNRGTIVTIRINRFTLASTAALEMADKPNGKRYGYWVLDGKCSRKAL